jgi:hypothetical protein
MHKWIASTLRYAAEWVLVLQILCNKCTYTLICIWTLTGGFICWILKHYSLIHSWWWYIQWPWPIRMQYKHWQSRGEEESYTKVIDIMFSEIQLDHKLQYEQREIIDINGVGRLYPFKISMSPRNKSTLFQQHTTWTCGPYTVVKVGLFQTLLWLHFDKGIPSSGIHANQRLVNEDWLALLGKYEIIWHTACSDTLCWGWFPSLEWSGHWQWHIVIHCRYITHIIPR